MGIVVNDAKSKGAQGYYGYGGGRYGYGYGYGLAKEGGYYEDESKKTSWLQKLKK